VSGGWHTVWSVGSDPFYWGNAGEGLLALAAVVFGGAAYLGVRRTSVLRARVALVVGAGLAAFFMSRTVQHVVDHDACTRASRDGSARVVEGVIRDFRPLTSVLQQPAYETFRVGDERISIPLFSDGCGYHRTVVEGGPFREGMPVRLLLWNGRILRVETRQDGQGQAARAVPTTAARLAR
jgi:hypothetical protein